MLKVNVREKGNVIIFTLEGDMIFNELKEVEEIVNGYISKQPKTIGLNCSKLNSLDSSGLGMMIQFSKATNASGIDLIMIDLPINIARMFDISKMESFFENMTNEEFESTYLS